MYSNNTSTPACRFATVVTVATAAMLVLLLSSATANATSIRRRATTCNGDSSLCQRLYSNVTFAGAHNSYAIEANGGTGSLASNQNVSLSRQLDSGIRMLQSQAHKSTNASATGVGIDLCHTSCNLFQGGALEYYLSQIKTWSDANPTEVITLLIVNSNGQPASTFGQAFQSTGLSSKMYTPTSTGTALTKYQWPTLGSMIDAGTPIVGFLASGADTSSVPYLLDEFTHMWENAYDQTSLPFNCTIDRIGSSVSDPSSLMYISNQFRDQSLFGSSELTTPDLANLGSTNSLATTISTSDSCAAQHGAVPNFILTDYSTVPNYSFLRAVAQMNGVSYTAPAASSSSSSSSSSSGATSVTFSLVSILAASAAAAVAIAL